MPRTRKVHASKPMSTANVTVVRHHINLRSIPTASPPVHGAAMVSAMFSAKPPSTDLWRSRYGRALNLNTIEQSLRSADWGAMQMLTDLSRETIDVDPHLASVLNKRFGALSALPWEVVPAEGFGVDEDKARFYADVVRGQLKRLNNFGQRLNQLAWALFDGRAALEMEWAMAATVPGLPTQVHDRFGAVNWLLADLGWIHPRRLQFGPERELRVCDDNSTGSFKACGEALRDFPYKFIQWTPQLFADYPEREGLSRRVLYWSFFKRFSARERQVLLELFGKPWRWLEVDEDSSADGDDLAEADTMLQNIGGNSSFRFPRGTKFQVEQPDAGAGQVHREVIEDSDKQMSKLVLGQTGTTDANPAGLNNSQADVMKDEQFVILVRDAQMLSEILETQLTDPIVALNFGAEELNHAPAFRLRADVPLDRTKELGRLKAAVEAGLEVSVAEAYEVSGFRQPKADEPVVKLETPPLHPMAVQPPPERPIIAHPETTALPGRIVQPIAPAGAGGLQGPETRGPEPGGTPPTNSGPGTGSPTGTEPNIDVRSPSLSRAHPADVALASNILNDAACTCPHCGDDSIQLAAGDDDPEETPETAPQPEEEVVGSIEVLVERGVKEGARETGKMAEAYTASVAGLEDESDINVALLQAHSVMDIQGLTRSLERRTLQGAMGGAISSEYEVETDNVLPVAEFEKVHGRAPVLLAVPPTDPNFVHKTLRDAVSWFKSKAIVTRNVFDQLEASAKRRAFTVAGMTNDEMLRKAQDELALQIQTGGTLRNFEKAVADRFVSAGFVPASASHVETIYRTNVLNAYNSGRHSHSTQPSVLAARPYWQIRTVNDGPPRQRRTHRRVHKWVLSASDSFWSRAYPPFGFNCRCRVVTMSQTEVDIRSLKVRTGGEVSGLPDPGFTSGTSTLL